MKKLQYLKVLLICGWKIIFYHFHYILKFVRHPERYSFEYRYKIVRKEITYVINHFHIDYNIKDLEKFLTLNEKCMIISNHLSDLDPLLLIVASEKPITFVSKLETFKFPFVGKIAKALEVFPLDRKNIMNQISQLKNVVTYLKDESKPSVIVYIEGTRNRHPETGCLPFHPGTLKIAQRANVPILVAATFGTFRVLDGHSYVKPYPVSYSFLDIVSKEEVAKANTIELAASLQERIEKEVDSLREYDKNFVLNTKISNKRKTLETRVDVRVNS